MRLTEEGVIALAACLRHTDCLGSFHATADHHAEQWNPRSWQRQFSQVDSSFKTALFNNVIANPVSRRQLKDMGRHLEQDAEFAAFVSAVFVWGAGSRPWIWPSKLAKLGADVQNLERLRQLCLEAKVRGPVEAYQLLRSSDLSVRVNGLGPSYGTKFLYFAGFDSRPNGDAPLILDKRVAASLRAFATESGEEFSPSLDFNWSPSAYGRYLEMVNEAAPRLANECECRQVAPDAVEFALFWLNGNRPWWDGAQSRDV